jgi:hypothetical protein
VAGKAGRVVQGKDHLQHLLQEGGAEEQGQEEGQEIKERPTN